jgi:hypothetical protein
MSRSKHRSVEVEASPGGWWAERYLLLSEYKSEKVMHVLFNQQGRYGHWL